MVDTLFSGQKDSHFRCSLSISAMHKAVVASTEGDIRSTMGGFPPSQSPRHPIPHHAHCARVEFLDEIGGSSQGEPNFSFGALDDDKLLIAVSESWLMLSNAEDSAELPPSVVAAVNIGLEWSSPPCPKRSQLDD